MKKIIDPWRSHPEYNCFVSKWHAEKNYQGWVNTIHDGILSTLIDEVCGWVVTRKLQTSGYTVQLNVKFKKAIMKVILRQKT